MITREELKSIRFVVNVSEKNLRTDGRTYKAYSITPVDGSQLRIECYLKYMSVQRYVLFFAKTIEEANEILKVEKNRHKLHKINPKRPLTQPVEKKVEEPIEAPIIEEPVVEEEPVIEEVAEEIVEEEPVIEEDVEEEPVEEASEEEEVKEETDYSKMKKSDLIALCEEKGLDSSGTKKELIKLLTE